MTSLHSPVYRSLLKRLQQARRQAGLSQTEVARAVGRPQSFVSKCESGERRIDAVELSAFARLYGKPLGYFVAEGDGTLDSGASISSEGRAAFATRRSAKSARRRRPASAAARAKTRR